MSLVDTGDGSTPLSPDELNDLIPDLTTREELNQFEFLNILEASRWALQRRNFNRNLEEPHLREIHRRMFDQTWKWAGQYRRTEKNLGVPHHRIRESLMTLLGDVRYQMDHGTYPADELVLRFHHRLVLIHPFPNGNGRHARLLADALILSMGERRFPWGGQDLATPADTRRAYIDALKRADQQDILPLLGFARSGRDPSS